MTEEFDEIQLALSSIAYPTRLRLLSVLRAPKALDEIHVNPGPGRSGERPDRPITRQAVLEHLQHLAAAGFVVKRPRSGGGKTRVEYVVDEARWFTFMEQLRLVAALSGSEPVGPSETITARTVGASGWDAGPKLVIVHGVREGRAFPLSRSALRKGRGWVIGRKSSADVSLGFDPFVSGENSEILAEGPGFQLIDLRAARNGTYLNWKRLPLGGSVDLEHGDIIGVGRSLLLFRTH